MHGLSTDKERQEKSVVEDFITALLERELCNDINGWSKLSEDDRDFVVHSHNGDILFDQIWYSNPVAAPIRIWPYNFGRTADCPI